MSSTHFSYSDPRGSRGKRRLLLVATLIVIALFLIDVLSGGKIRSLVRTVGSDVWRLGTGAAEHAGLGDFFTSRATLLQENATLEAQAAQYQEESAALSVVDQENTSLRAMLHLSQISPGIAAPVVSSAYTSPYSTFLVGAGSAEGVSKGDIAETSDGFVVGTVSDVSLHSAVVSELLSPGSSTDVSIDGTALTLAGQGGGEGLGKIPIGVSVATSDPALAPSLGLRPVGTIGALESDPGSGSVEVYVKLPVNLESLQYVYLVPNGD